jgi:hypothetical protein
MTPSSRKDQVSCGAPVPSKLQRMSVWKQLCTRKCKFGKCKLLQMNKPLFGKWKHQGTLTCSHERTTFLPCSHDFHRVPQFEFPGFTYRSSRVGAAGYVHHITSSGYGHLAVGNCRVSASDGLGDSVARVIAPAAPRLRPTRLPTHRHHRISCTCQRTCCSWLSVVSVG